MFADISGFTSISEAMDPEDVRSLADRCAEIMGEQVRKFGGTVVSVMGDAVMAVFGAPVAHEDDPERAVRAAFEMRDAIASSGVGDAPLRLHAGINTGDVMAGEVGPKERRDFTVVGDTTNTAARLMSAAQPGTIVVGRQTYEATRRVIRYEALAPVMAKGKQQAVDAWRAVEPLTPPGDGSKVETTGPLVGREDELNLLLGVWSRTRRERRPHLVTLIAPPGIGKSRVARELTGRLRAEGVRCLLGRSLAYGGGTGYGPFAEQVRAAAGIDPSADSRTTRHVLGNHLRSLTGADDADLLANLSVLLGASQREDAPDRAAMFLSARRYVTALARAQPTVLVFEDIHWADQSTLDLISTLASRVHDVPLLLLCLARPELFDEHPSWGAAQPAYTAMPLEPLPDDAARELVLTLLSGTRAGTAEQLVQAGGGNPLFLEELAATVAARQETAAAELPTSVKSIITARLDLLTPAERKVVQHAAVVGDVFWDLALAALDPGTPPPSLADALDRLATRGLIRPQPTSSIPGAEEFAFKHALIRQVAYEIVSRANRLKMHGVVAGWLERALGDRAPEMATVLAHHWKQGGDVERAIDYLVTAANRANRAWAKAEAVALISDALHLVEETGQSGREPELLMRRGQAYQGLGDHANAVKDLEAAIPRLHGAAKAQALLDRARVAMLMVDVDNIVKYGSQAGEFARKFEDPLLQAKAAFVEANGLVSSADVDGALHSTRRVVETWPEEGRRGDPDYAAATMFTGLYSYWLGEFPTAAELSQQAVDLGLAAQALEPTTQAMAQLALSLVAIGRGSEAVKWFDRSVSLGLEWEALPRFSSRSMNMWAGAARESLLDLTEARRLSTEGGELARRAAFPPAIASSAVDLLFLDLAEGDFGNAEVSFPQTWEIATALKGVHYWLFLIRLLDAKASIAIAAGKPAEGIESALESIATARKLPRRKYVAHGTLTLGRCLTAAGRLEEAVRAFAEAAHAAGELPHLATEWRANLELARARFAIGDDDGAAVAAGRARAAVDTFAAGLSDAGRQRFLAAEEVKEVLALTR